MTLLDQADPIAQHPLRERRRPGRFRQCFMGGLLLLLCAIIAGYAFITNSDRVRAISEKYLSQMLGGRVVIKDAQLSIFDGLRLEGVDLWVDECSTPDCRLFSAEALVARAELWGLVRGQLQSAQIMAINPRITLCEDTDTGRWNYTRLTRPSTTRPSHDQPFNARAVVLPQLLLRGGLVEYRRIVNGRSQLVGSLAIDGQLQPAPSRPNCYTFDLSSRAPGQPSGPRLMGAVDMDGPSITASLDGLIFDDTVRRMLPAKVQAWWELHRLSGKVRIPRFHYSFPSGAAAPDFNIEVELQRVSLAVQPRELMGRRQFARAIRARPGIPSADDCVEPIFEMVGRCVAIERVMPPPPVQIENVTGRVVFTPDGVRLWGLGGSLLGNLVRIDGFTHGYSNEAAGSIRINAANMRLPQWPSCIDSLPREIRNLYRKLRPSGLAHLSVQLERAHSDAPLIATGELKVVDGNFCFDEFAYPLSHITGTVRFGRDKMTTLDRVDIIGVEGLGCEGSPNQNARVKVEGWISPVDRQVGLDLKICGQSVHMDSLVRAAMPCEAREVVERFDRIDPSGQIVPVDIFGDFTAHIQRERGHGRKVKYAIDLDVRQSGGAFRDFPYPLRNGVGVIRIRPDHVAIEDFRVHQDAAWLTINGRVNFGKGRPIEPLLALTAGSVPVDDDLLDAMPSQWRQWIKRLGMNGLLDMRGQIIREARSPAIDGEEDSNVVFDLQFKLRDGEIWPVRQTHALTDASAEFRVRPTSLTISKFDGRRGDGKVSGAGEIRWPDEKLSYDLQATGHNVPADPVLRQLIGNQAGRAWDALRPAGTLHFDIACRGKETGLPTGSEGALQQSYELKLRPADLSITPASIPLPMQVKAGTVLVTPEQVKIIDLQLAHDAALVNIAGAGDLRKEDWKLSTSGSGIAFTDEVKAALPKAAAELVKSIELTGEASFDLPTIIWTSSEIERLDQNASAAERHDQFDFDGTFALKNASMQTGIPLAEIDGSARLSGRFIDGSLNRLSANIEASRMTIAGRPMSNVSCDLIKPEGLARYRFSDLRGKLAGGDLAARVDLDLPEEGDSRYAVAAILKDVGVRDLLGEEEYHGRLRADLALEGNIADPGARRGRGDIEIQGHDLYRIPVVLGMLQITNLSLPIKSPFEQATTRYIVEGHRITFEQIELMAPRMLMQGNGWLDFATKKVALTFTTDNPEWPKIPMLDDLIQGAKKELFQIHVRGTVEEPKVSAKTMNTFTTTLDEVLNGEGKPTTKKAR